MCPPVFKTVHASLSSPTHEHAEELYKNLVAGMTIKQACVIANDEVFLQISNVNEEQAEMVVNGDDEATIDGVYTNSEVDPRPWYKVL